MKQIDFKDLKINGFIRQAQKEYVSLRIRVSGGQVDTFHLKNIYKIAENHGRGYIHLTSRQSIEIPFIHFNDIEIVKKELLEAGLEAAKCGTTIRTITACQGKNVCPSGLIETSELAKELDLKYYETELPHKFKIGITGCRNNCLKAEENDLGIKGAIKPLWNEMECTFCGLCEIGCPENAISVDRDNKKLTFKEERCICCGKCIKICPTGAWNGQSGFFVYFGGLFGNKISIGKQLLPAIFKKDDLYKIIDGTLNFFKTYGKQKERFGNTINRVGWDIFENNIKKVAEL